MYSRRQRQRERDRRGPTDAEQNLMGACERERHHVRVSLVERLVCFNVWLAGASGGSVLPPATTATDPNLNVLDAQAKIRVRFS